MAGFVLCADDYGLAKHIDDGIISLVQQGRVSAVSCMTTSPRWPEAAQRLLPYREQADIGLHLNLTDGPLLSGNFKAQPLWLCILRTHVLPGCVTIYAAEIAAQWQKFVQVMGHAPDFVDGHQHIHILPQVRCALLQHLAGLAAGDIKLQPRAEAGGRGACYVRVPFNLASPQRLIKDKLVCSQRGGHASACFKQQLIPWLGGKALHRQLVASNWRYNTSFAGMYNFKQTNYRAVFQRELRQLQAGGLMMCHPGRGESGVANDSLAAVRQREWDYFASEAYVSDCQHADLYPMRMADTMHC